MLHALCYMPHEIMKLLYGKPIADKILSQLKCNIQSESTKPGLAVVLVGEERASKLYVNLKEKKAQEIGMNFFRYDLPTATSEKEILKKIEALNNDSAVHGIIVQLPLPEGFNTDKIIAAIEQKKDVDGFSSKGGDSILEPVFPKAMIKLIEGSDQKLEGKNAALIVNSEMFGRIMSIMLEKKGILSEYVLKNDISSDLGKIKNADIIVSAVGSPSLLKGEMFKEGAVIIDGGIEKIGEQVFGDVDFASTKNMSGFITPVPGGVGPLTIACLLENTFIAFKAQQR